MAYKFSKMSSAQVEDFLQAPRIAIVGTNGVSGAPQLTPVWYLYENERIYMSIGVNSAKYRNLARDSRISICVPGAHPDARAVMIYGKADLVRQDSAEHDDICWRLTRRYYDSDEDAQAFLDSLPVEGESALAIVVPKKILAEDYN